MGKTKLSICCIVSFSTFFKLSILKYKSRREATVFVVAHLIQWDRCDQHSKTLRVS